MDEAHDEGCVGERHLPTEVPWSRFKPGAAGEDGPVASLQAALEALERVNVMTDLDEYGWVVVTWRP